MKGEKDGRTEFVRVSLTKKEFAEFNAMRLEHDREMPMAAFLRSLLIAILADDKAAHSEAAE